MSMSSEQLTDEYLGSSSSQTTSSGPVCSEPNLHECVGLVNQQLQVFGLPNIAPVNFDGLPTVQSVNVVNLILELIKQHEVDDQLRREVEDKNQKITKQLDALQSRVEILEAQKVEAEREAYFARFKAENLQADVKKANQATAVAKQELQKTVAKAQSTKTQFAHELRKKDTELEKLKATLQKNTADRAAQLKFGIEVMNTATKVQKILPEESPIVSKILVETYKERERELVAENHQLRTILFTLEKTLRTEIRFTEDGLYAGQKVVAPVVLDQAQLKMPFSVIKSMIEGSSEELLEQIKREAIMFKQSLINATCHEQTEKIISLEKQLEEYKQVLEEQEKLLEMNLQMTSEGSDYVMNVSVTELESTNEEIERLKNQLIEQKKQLEMERKEFTKAAIELGRERSEVMKTRAALEEEKRSLETTKFLASLPQTPDWVKKAINQSGSGDLENVPMSPFTPRFKSKFFSPIEDKPPSTSAIVGRLNLGDESPTKAKGSLPHLNLAEADENTNPNA